MLFFVAAAACASVDGALQNGTARMERVEKVSLMCSLPLCLRREDSSPRRVFRTRPALLLRSRSLQKAARCGMRVRGQGGEGKSAGERRGGDDGEEDARRSRDALAREQEFDLSSSRQLSAQDERRMSEALRERVELLERKETQWREIIAQFAVLEQQFGLKFLSDKTGEPLPQAWLFVALSILLPFAALWSIGRMLHF